MDNPTTPSPAWLAARDVIEARIIEMVPHLGPHWINCLASQVAEDILSRLAAHQPPITVMMEDESHDGEVGQDKKLHTLVDDWRATSNVMSEADGDGPIRDTLRHCAKQLEEIMRATVYRRAAEVLGEEKTNERT